MGMCIYTFDFAPLRVVNIGVSVGSVLLSLFSAVLQFSWFGFLFFSLAQCVPNPYSLLCVYVWKRARPSLLVTIIMTSIPTHVVVVVSQRVRLFIFNMFF